MSKVRRGGLVTGLHEGITRVEARAAGGSSAKGIVRVVLLRGVRVFAPLTVVEAGAVLPLWATGAGGAGENPLAMGSLEPHFEFHWALSSEQVAHLQHVLAPAGVAVEKVRAFAFFVPILLPTKLHDLSLHRSTNRAACAFWPSLPAK